MCLQRCSKSINPSDELFQVRTGSRTLLTDAKADMAKIRVDIEAHRCKEEEEAGDGGMKEDGEPTGKRKEEAGLGSKLAC